MKKGKAFMNRRSKSRKGDLFETPYSMTEQLLEREEFNELILEPASGKGSMVDVLREYKYIVRDYDLNFGEFKGDFLKEEMKFESIVTNPPFNKADEFVLHAQKICTNKFAFLLRTNYLSGQRRAKLDVYKWLRTVYIFSRMSDLRAPIREDGKYPTAGIVYAWFVREIGYTGKPEIEFIDNSMHCLRKNEE